MTDRTRALLVCVYYRVGAGDAAGVIASVREFQRTLRLDAAVAQAEVLIRCQLPSDPSAADVRPAHAPPSGSPSGSRVPEADTTVMETYRLALPDTPDADAAARAFLATLAAAARPRAGLLRGGRHVELFAPCAS